MLSPSSLARAAAAVSTAAALAMLMFPTAATRRRSAEHAVYRPKSGAVGRRTVAPPRGAGPDSMNPDLASIGGYWQQRLPEHHRGEPIRGGRRVAILPGRTWPHQPEHCQAGTFDTLWLLDGQLLVCRGCGLNAT